jgi:glycosyltransferase involved in cell wall biosynthesis
MNKLCYVATIPAVVHSFLRGHILAAAEKFEVTVVCNNTDVHLLDGIKARLILLPIERKPSPWRDMLALFQLFKLFRREHFDIVHSHMPKTGLLAMLASRLAGVPIRINTFHGEVWATRRGWRRAVLKILDRVTGLLATNVFVVSPSQRDFLVSEGVLPKGRGVVIGNGSICGVDAHRFHPDIHARNAVRAELNISPEQIVILFLGRLNRDKGILDLAAAFADIATRRGDVALVLVGAEEDVPFARVQEICGVSRDHLRRLDFSPCPERYMNAADIFCLPSYREGFGQVIIEAAACGVPTVASRIYGITDAVDDGNTGLLFPAGDVAALTGSLLTLVGNEALRQKMGEIARVRALELFASEKITGELVNLYEMMMAHK